MKRIDEELERAAREAGLEAFLQTDPEGLARAYRTARGYRSRRPGIDAPEVEPAHCFRTGAPAGGE